MTLEEMKQELEENGYVVKKLRSYSQKKIQDRTEKMRKIMRKYVSETIDLELWKGDPAGYGEVVEYMRRRISFYGYKAYKDISDEKWPEIETHLIEDGKHFVDSVLKEQYKNHWLRNFYKA